MLCVRGKEKLLSEPIIFLFQEAIMGDWDRRLEQMIEDRVAFISTTSLWEKAITTRVRVTVRFGFRFGFRFGSGCDLGIDCGV